MGCESQTMSEVIGVVGTPFSLVYASDRAPGRVDDFDRTLSVSGSELPPGVKAIEVEITVAGQQIKKTLEPAASLVEEFAWDGKDAYGREVIGAQALRWRVGYTYDAVYYEPADFMAAFGQVSSSELTAVESRQEVTLWQEQRDVLGHVAGHSFGLGGWSLDVQHAYDPAAGVLYRGDGRRRSADEIGAVIEAVAGLEFSSISPEDYPEQVFSEPGAPAELTVLFLPYDVHVGPDGLHYFADQKGLWRVAPDGTLELLSSGVLCEDPAGCMDQDGGLLSDAGFFGVPRFDFGPDGAIFIADELTGRVWRVDPTDMTIHHYAGNGSSTFCALLPDCTTNPADDIPALESTFGGPRDIAVGPDGTVYIAEPTYTRVRAIGTDGIVRTVAGTSDSSGFSGDGGPATLAQLDGPLGIALSAEGSLYIADAFNRRVRQVTPDGIITTIAGTGSQCDQGDILCMGDGNLATNAGLDPIGVAVGPEGNVYIADEEHARVRVVTPNGLISTLAGDADGGTSTGTGGPAKAAGLTLTGGIAVTPAGEVLITEEQVVRVIRSPFPTAGTTTLGVVSEDGRELYLFDGNGKQLETRNATTGTTRWSFAYDDAGWLTGITDADGLTTTIARAADGSPMSITGPYGQTTSLGVDANGFLNMIDNPAGEAALITYDEGGLIESFEDPRGHLSTYQWDEAGRLISHENPLGGVQTLTRTDFGLGYQVDVVSGAGIARTYTWDQYPEGGGERLFSGLGVDASVVEGADQTTIMTLPSGTMVETAISGDSRFGLQTPYAAKQTTTTPGGLATTVARTRSVKWAAGALNDAETVTETVAINGKTWTTFWNVVEGSVTETSPMGRTRTFTLDAEGRLLSRRQGEDTPLTVTYDADGRTETINFGAGTWAWAYDPNNGHVASILDPVSKTHGFEYDAANRTSAEILGDGRSIGATYDANGNRASLDREGVVHAFSYNGMDQLESWTQPTGETWTWSYELDGRLVEMVRPDDLPVTYDYDVAGRLETVAAPDATLSYSYDAEAGNLVSLDEGDVQLSWTYDGDLVTGSTTTGPFSATVLRTWNEDRQVATRSIDGQSEVGFAYDDDGLVTQAGGALITWDPNAPRVSEISVGGATTTYTYDAEGRLQSSSFSHSDVGELHAMTWSYDEIGRITALTDDVQGANESVSFVYDNVGNLSQVNAGVAFTYGYDARDNRDVSEGVAATYDDSDRLLTRGTVAYTYDAIGNRATAIDGGATTTTYDHDGFGRLLKVDLPGGTSISYAYDGLGRRVARYVDGSFDRGWVYKDTLNPIAEVDPGGAVTARFVYGSKPHVPDYMIVGGNTYAFATDHRGSVRLVVDATTGAVVQALRYNAWGVILEDTNPGFQSFGYAGGLYDADTGLVRFGARDYDPLAGRWLQPDPTGFWGSLNQYRYAGNDPVNMIDPNGQIPLAVPGFMLLGGGLDIAGQLAFGDGKIDWCSVIFSTVTGGLGVGVGGLAAKATTNAGRIAVNVLGNGALSGGSQAALNALEGKEVFDESVFWAATTSMAFEGGGEVLEQIGGKIGKAAETFTDASAAVGKGGNQLVKGIGQKLTTGGKAVKPGATAASKATGGGDEE